MQRLFEFIGHHPYLATGAVVAAAAVAFYEIRERMQAFAALTAMQAVRLMNQGALVIDLRGKELYDAGHIGDARNVPAAELEAQAESLKKWRDKNVITYCDSGTSGASGARTLTKLGFTKVFNLQGGLNAWVKDNLPLAKTPGRQGKLEVSQPAVTVYMSDWCPYCQRAKELLTQKHVAFSEINVDEEPKFREEMIARSSRRTVPQIFIGDKHVGGCDDLFALDRSGELDRLIQGA